MPGCVGQVIHLPSASPRARRDIRLAQETTGRSMTCPTEVASALPRYVLTREPGGAGSRESMPPAGPLDGALGKPAESRLT